MSGLVRSASHRMVTIPAVTLALAIGPSNAFTAPGEGDAGGSGATSVQAAHAVTGRLSERERELAASLKTHRSTMVALGEKHQASQIVVERGRLLQEQIGRISVSSPAVRPALEPSAGLVRRLMKPAQRQLATDKKKFDAAVDAAAEIQADHSAAERRLAAFRRAVGAAEKVAAGDTSLGIPSSGWGGGGTAPVTAESIDRFLESKASPMAGSGEDFLRAGYRWNVDPRLVVAIAGAESFFGSITCAPHNGWGWGCPSSPRAFRTWAEGIDAVTKGLAENYVGQGLTSVTAIHHKYAPPGASNDPNGMNLVWPRNVATYLLEQGGNPGNVRGPRTGPGSGHHD